MHTQTGLGTEARVVAVYRHDPVCYHLWGGGGISNGKALHGRKGHRSQTTQGLAKAIAATVLQSLAQAS
ncbi:hypothetical protein [Candidatus Methylacidiphilum fumarolicum]|uniref:hypothetical protein n=1 Tax=Candidatus Methylacidiphilum fumarolicum TaxID=591154 RepID=UPI001294852C|nr:hypothetical protein [Candidatus Methylacidiphilum fumarolicum]